MPLEWTVVGSVASFLAVCIVLVWRSYRFPLSEEIDASPPRPPARPLVLSWDKSDIRNAASPCLWCGKKCMEIELYATEDGQVALIASTCQASDRAIRYRTEYGPLMEVLDEWSQLNSTG